MKPIGRDGRPIPLPPDARSGWEVLGAYTRVGFWIAAWLIGVAGLLLVVTQEPFTRFSWQPIAFKLVLLCGVVVVLFLGFSVLNTVVAFVTWPFRRKQAGQTFERRIERFSPEQIADEITLAKQVLDYLRDPKKRRGWQRWLAWLERQANIAPTERTALAEGIYPAKRSVAIRDGVFFVAMLVGGVWMAWQSQTWWLWGVFGLIVLLCGMGAATHIGERLELTADTLTYYAAGRLQWSVPREHIATNEDGVGSATYELHDLSTGRLLGSVDGATFGAETVEALADLFPPLIKREEA